MKYWFVAYEYESKQAPRERHLANVILCGGHPVTWFGSPPELFRKYYVFWLTFFCEIDEATVREAIKQNYIPIETVEQ